MPNNTYTNISSTTASGYISADYISVEQLATIYSENISADIKTGTGIHPVLAFKYIKKKFGTIEKIFIERRLDKLEKAFYNAVDNGQEMLSQKLLSEIAREQRETLLYACNIRTFVERDAINKVKLNIRGGHISDTLLKNYTRVIPRDVLEKKKKVEHLFDDFVIYHYYNNEIEQKLEKKQEMSDEEKSAMRDPILFGTIKETNRLYFIADWEDEFCDLTFDEIVDVVATGKIDKKPNLNV